MRQWQCSFPILLWATLKNDWSKIQLYCMFGNKTYAHNYIQNTGKQMCTCGAQIPTVHTYTCCISHSLRHSPASRLSPAVLLSMSRALEVEDLMWSLKDLCNSNSLIERDMPISIHRYRIYVRLLTCTYNCSCSWSGKLLCFCYYCASQFYLTTPIFYFYNICAQLFNINLSCLSVLSSVLVLFLPPSLCHSDLLKPGLCTPVCCSKH